MPKVPSWAKKLAGRSSGKDAGQSQGSREESVLSSNSGSRESPEKKSKNANESCHNDSGAKPNSEKKIIADKGSSPEKSLNPLRRFSTEKRHNSDRRPSPEKRLSSEKKASPEKRHHSDRRPSPEKRLSPEKTSGFAKRFASFRILHLDRKSPEKNVRSKSKSPDPELNAEGESSERLNKHETDSDPEKLPSLMKGDTVISKTIVEKEETTEACAVASENKDVGCASEQISPEREDEDNTKENITNKEAEASTNSDRSIDRRTSRGGGGGRPSISERLYGEVIKEFDKIRITKTKTTSATCDGDSSTGVSEKIQSGQGDNCNSCVPDKESSDDSISKCLNNNLKNSRFTVSAVSEEENQEKLFSKNKIEADTDNRKEENIDEISSSRGLTGHSSPTFDPSEHSDKKGNHNLKEHFDHFNLKVGLKNVPLVSPEVSDTDVSEDESNDQIHIPSEDILSQCIPHIVTNHDDISKSKEPSKSSLPPALPTQLADVIPQSTAEGFEVEHNSNEIDKPAENSSETLSHIPHVDSDTSKENLNNITSVSSISLNSAKESLPQDSKDHLEVRGETLPASLDDATETDVKVPSFPSDMLPDQKNKLSVSSSAPVTDDDTQNKVDEALQSQNCKEHIHTEEQLHPTPTIELFIQEDSTSDSLPSSPSPTPAIQASSLNKSDGCETEVTPNDLSGSVKNTDHQLSVSKQEESSVLPLNPSVAYANEICSSDLHYPSSLENVEENKEQPKEEIIHIENENANNDRKIMEDENHSKNATDGQQASTSLQTEANELLSSQNLCPVEVSALSEETGPCTSTSDIVPNETIIENEDKFKNEILAILDKSFDNRRISSANDVDYQESLNNNTEVKDANDDGNGFPSDVHESKVSSPISIPGSLNSSFNSSVDGKRVFPVPRRRVSLSRVNGSIKGSEVDLKKDLPIRETCSQPTSMTVLNTNAKVDSKSSLNESYGELSSEGGGSLPASPSVPRRKKKSHPVPMTRSYHTLNTRSGHSRVNGRRCPKDITLGHLPDKTPPPRPPMPSVTCHESPLQESALTFSPHINNVNLRHSTPNKDSNSSMNGSITIDEKTNPERKPVPKARTKISLNPFDSDDDDVVNETKLEVTGNEQKPQKPAKVSLNPFDSEDDEEVVNANAQTVDQRKPPPQVGYNPFEDDDDEEQNEDEDSFQDTSNKKIGHHVQPGRFCASSGKLNDSFSSISSHTSNVANEMASTNPFDEDDDDEEEISSFRSMPLTRGSIGRQSLAVRGSPSPFQRDGVRASLPSSGKILLSKKKRQAPLPPGYKPPQTSSASTTPLPPRYRTALWRGESSTSLNQSPLRKDSTTSSSTLSLTSPRRAPPPRPPPPKIKSVSLAQLQ